MKDGCIIFEWLTDSFSRCEIPDACHSVFLVRREMPAVGTESTRPHVGSIFVVKSASSEIFVAQIPKLHDSTLLRGAHDGVGIGGELMGVRVA